MKTWKLIFIAFTVLLASCGKSETTGILTVSKPDTEAQTFKTVVQGDRILVDYSLKLDDGKLYDTTIPSEAPKSIKYDPKRIYSPFLISVGERQMPKGFENSLVGMRNGETKTFEVPSSEGYAELKTEKRMAKRMLESEYEETYSVEKYRDVFETTVTDTQFAERGKPIPKIGEVIDSGGGITSKVVKIEGGMITVAVNNKKNPFYWKKLVVGLVGTDDGNDIEIINLEGGNVTIRVKNLTSPFVWKPIIPGTSVIIGNEKHTIKQVEGEMTVLEISHELAGKTLRYDVTVREIK